MSMLNSGKLSAVYLCIVMAVVMSFVTSKAAAQSCPSGMVSYWRFDEGVGITATDSMDSNTGYLVYQPIWTPGKVSNALLFDGFSSYVTVPNSPNLNVTEGITLEAWIYPMQVEAEYRAQDIISKHASPGGTDDAFTMQITAPQKILFLLNDGKGDLNSPGYVRLISSSSLQNDTWYHVVATWDGTIMKLYINGVEDASTAFQGPIHVSSLPVGIGRNGGDGWYEYFAGNIDEAAIYNRALTSQEIAQHYQKGLSGSAYCEVSPPPALACQGFMAPAGLGPANLNKNKVVPLKAMLVNGTVPVTDMDIVAPPAIKVLYDSGTGSTIDVTANALPAGKSSEGSAFFFDGTWWHFNLKNSFTEPGTYSVSMVSGDASAYSISPTCSLQFVIK